MFVPARALAAVNPKEAAVVKIHLDDPRLGVLPRIDDLLRGLGMDDPLFRDHGLVASQVLKENLAVVENPAVAEKENDVHAVLQNGVARQNDAVRLNGALPQIVGDLLRDGMEIAIGEVAVEVEVDPDITTVVAPLIPKRKRSRLLTKFPKFLTNNLHPARIMACFSF